jgi:branched-chain amino acid transport system substrate-binding protein
MRILKTVSLAMGVAALTLGHGAIAKNAPGVTDSSIKIGNTNPYSGPASSYSTIGKSIGAYFKMVNANGGVNGRKIDWVSVDDGYSPPKTKEQFRKLIEREKVAFMFQSLGTPTNSAVHRYMNKKKVPHLFVATGATKWGDPENFPWTMGFQPNYQTMGKIFGGYVLKNHPDGKIGILYQNDDYGKDYVTGLRAALGDKADKMIVKSETYEVTDPTIDSQIVNLKASGANIFYNVSIPKFAAQAIKKSHDIGWNPVHLLNDVSNSVASVLKPAGLDKSQGILSTAYLKDPTDVTWKDDEEFADWLAFMDKYYPDGDKTNPFNGYGYAVGTLMEHVLKQCGDDLSRENIMKQAANVQNFRLKMALPGIMVNTGAKDFYPLEQAQMMRFKGESWERFGPLISADSL